MSVPLMPKRNVEPLEESPTPIDPEEAFQRDQAAMGELKKLKDYYREAGKILKSSTEKELKDDSLWSNCETANPMTKEEWKAATPQEINLRGQEEVEAKIFRDLRMAQIEDRKLNKILDDIETEKPTATERIAKLSPEAHKKLWEKRMGI